MVRGWLVGTWELEFNVPFQDKYGYIRDDNGQRIIVQTCTAPITSSIYIHNDAQ